VVNRLKNKKERIKVQKNHEKLRKSSLDKYGGIIALSSRWDSILMWSHYANNHKGYCIGFDSKKLVDSKMFSSFGLVSYPNDLK